MPTLLSLLLLATAADLPPAPAVPVSDGRLAVEGVGIGDAEGRLITLMPTARCSSMSGEGAPADRWCRMPDQRVFGVMPDSLTAMLRADAVVTVIARVSTARWALLRANLVGRLGPPEERALSSPPSLADEGTGEAAERLRWERDGVELVVAPADAEHTLLTLRPLQAGQ